MLRHDPIYTFRHSIQLIDPVRALIVLDPFLCTDWVPNAIYHHLADNHVAHHDSIIDRLPSYMHPDQSG